MNLVSIIIPVFNYGNLIEETLQSVAQQSYSDIECIIIDDGSTDSTGERIEAFCRKDPRFKYYYQNNQGLAAARNAGLTRSKGDYIAFLDADDLWTEAKISNQIKIFKERECQFVFSDCLSFTPDGISHYTKSSSQKISSPVDLLDSDAIVGSSSSVIIKREVYEKVGLFDINLRSLEDLDYWFRCALSSFKFEFCDSVDVKIRVHHTSMSTNQLKMYQYHLIVLERQLSGLKLLTAIQEPNSLKKVLMKRLGRVRWYATELQRHDLSLYIHLLGFRVLGFRYFNRLNFVNFLNDGKRFLWSTKTL